MKTESLPTSNLNPDFQAQMRYDSTTHYAHQKEEELEAYRSRNRILVVDDESDSCLAYQVVLQDSGYQCNSYTDSVKALQEFTTSYYDLVILDIKMPKLDGFALYEKIRELDKTVQIIFISAAETYYEKFRKKYYPKLNIDINTNCFQKPIENQELIQIVNKTINTRDKN